MKAKFKKGDLVTLKPADQLLDIFNKRNFFTKIHRAGIAVELGGKTGTVHNIEEKYQFDYFYFKHKKETDVWSIPYESINTLISRGEFEMG